MIYEHNGKTVAQVTPVFDKTKLVKLSIHIAKGMEVEVHEMEEPEYDVMTMKFPDSREQP